VKMGEGRRDPTGLDQSRKNWDGSGDVECLLRGGGSGERKRERKGIEVTEELFGGKGDRIRSRNFFSYPPPGMSREKGRTGGKSVEGRTWRSGYPQTNN